MAIRAYITTLVSSIQAAENIEENGRFLRFTTTKRKVNETNNHSGVAQGRRALLLSTVAAATQTTDSKTQLLQKYLKKSEDNKTKNDKERLDSYYKRNYKDYFALEEGTLRQKKELTEAEKGILDWLETNK